MPPQHAVQLWPLGDAGRARAMHSQYGGALACTAWRDHACSLSVPCVCVPAALPFPAGAADALLQESEEELNQRLRELKGLDKERDKHKKLSKQEQEEENLFKKNRGACLHLQQLHACAHESRWLCRALLWRA
jgi:hypothetical protein